MKNKTVFVDLDEDVLIDLIEGVGGTCLSINNIRVAGPKPLGSGRVYQTWTKKVYEIVNAMTNGVMELDKDRRIRELELDLELSRKHYEERRLETFELGKQIETQIGIIKKIRAYDGHAWLEKGDDGDAPRLKLLKLLDELYEVCEIIPVIK